MRVAQAAGRAMLAEAPALLEDLRSSMAATHSLAAAAAAVNGSKCWPYVAGRTQCAELKIQSSDRDSVKKRHFCAVLISNASFYQDRLRTNIGKALKRGVVAFP
jgi:hypothetical protein